MAGACVIWALASCTGTSPRQACMPMCGSSSSSSNCQTAASTGCAQMVLGAQRRHVRLNTEPPELLAVSTSRGMLAQRTASPSGCSRLLNETLTDTGHFRSKNLEGPWLRVGCIKTSTICHCDGREEPQNGIAASMSCVSRESGSLYDTKFQ
jgi:hypothetical protein